MSSAPLRGSPSFYDLKVGLEPSVEEGRSAGKYCFVNLPCLVATDDGSVGEIAGLEKPE